MVNFLFVIILLFGFSSLISFDFWVIFWLFIDLVYSVDIKDIVLVGEILIKFFKVVVFL